MEVKKAIKRIFAIAAATGLVGATIGGALAYDLATYPAPFVNNGVLSPADSVIVVGANAKTQDVVGAIEIGASLQAAATTVTPLQVPGTIVEPTVTEGVKIQRSGNKMDYSKDISEVKQSLDNQDLPTMLQDGTFDKSDYTQKLTFGNLTGIFDYFSPGRVDKTEFNGGDYLYFPDNQNVYTYTLTFDTPYSFTYNSATDNSLVSKTLNIQGQDYTVTNVLKASDGSVSQMDLLAGESTKWLQQDQPLTVGEHTLTVVNVDENGDKCGIEVDGTVKWINKGDTETFGNLEVGVTDAIPVHTQSGGQDTCEINVGAHKLTLNNNGRVKLNDQEIKGSTVHINASTTSGDWNFLQVSYNNKKDDFGTDQYGPAQYVAPGKAWTDPVFGNFKVLFGGVSGNYEKMDLQASGSDATYTFQNVDGRTVEVPWTVVSDAMHLGDSDTSQWIVNGTTTVNLNSVPDAYLWYVISTGGGNGELHVLHFDSYDDTTHKITFNDETYGNDVTTDPITADGSVQTVGVGTLGDITLSYNAGTNVLGFTPTGVTATTRYGAQVNIGENFINMTSPDKDSDVQTSDQMLSFGMTVNSDGDIEVSAPSLAGGTFVASNENVQYKNTDVKEYVTEKGIQVQYDATTDHAFAHISYPENDAYASVFVGPLSASVSSVAGGNSTAAGALNEQTVNKIPVGLAVLDTDAQAMSKNMIVVGGPCINLIANEIEHPSGQCYSGYQSGVAKIQAFNRNGKVALLVAGMDAQDTLGAAYVLRDFEDYKGKLTGNGVDIAVASLTDIQVTPMTGTASNITSTGTTTGTTGSTAGNTSGTNTSSNVTGNSTI